MIVESLLSDAICPAPPGFIAAIAYGSTGAVITRPCGPVRSDWQTHHKARAQRVRSDIRIGRADIFRPDHAAMRFNNLL